jgi:hypothetical protein
MQMPLYYKDSYPKLVSWAYEDRRNTSYFEPVLIFHAGQRGGRDGQVYMPFGIPANDYDRPFTGTGTLWVPQPLPCAFSINYNDPDGVDPMLAYSDIRIDSGITVIGLFRRFMMRRWAQIQRAPKWSCNFWWPLGKWLTFGRSGRFRHNGYNIEANSVQFTPGANKISISGQVEDYPTAQDLGTITHGG